VVKLNIIRNSWYAKISLAACSSRTALLFYYFINVSCRKLLIQAQL
jgi:hypothetical protein